MGYEEGGQLTEAVRRKPFSVVLFDEIEKAHPDVFNALLQILEDGRLTDSQGRSVDFKNTVIIMTSNLGTADLRKASVGFAKTSEAVTYEKMKEKVNDALKPHFRPEFLNRIDDVIVFHELTKDEVTEIIDLMIKRVRTSWRARAWLWSSPRRPSTSWSSKGYDPTLGARPAAPGPAAPGRGSAVREDPVEGVPGRRDHHRRRGAGPRDRRAGRSSSGPSRGCSRRRSRWPAPAAANSIATPAKGDAGRPRASDPHEGRSGSQAKGRSRPGAGRCGHHGAERCVCRAAPSWLVLGAAALAAALSGCQVQHPGRGRSGCLADGAW